MALDKVVKFFVDIYRAYQASETAQAIYTAFTIITAVVGVKGFLQARQMLSKGQDIMANKTAAGGKIPVIYGTRRVGCQIVYMDTAQNRSKDLFVVYALSVGECSEIVPSSIEIDGNSILDGNIYKGGGYVGSDRNGQTGFSHHQPLNTASQVGDVQYSNAGTLGTNPALRYSFVFNLHHGASSQTADPMLRASIPTEWTTNHKLNGICYIAASFDYDKKGMYKGVPQITVQVKGKKVYDPRESGHTFGDPSTYQWSSNPALCFLDYITNDEYGKGLAESQINMTTISSAANKCDTKVDQPYYNGAYQDVTWSGDSGDDFIVIDDNADWWQNKVDEFIDIRDVNDTSIFSDDITIKGSTRYEFYDATQENRLYIDGTLPSTYTNEAGSAKAQVKRFHCNGYIDTNKNVMDNAKELLANMRGILNYVNGKYELQIEDTGSSTFSITDDHIIADAGISVDYGNKDKKANKVVIEFFNANKKYELDTATVLHDATPEYYSDDGEVLEIKAEFPYVTDPYIAYNMGKAILTRSRNQTTMQFLGTPEMYKLNVGDIVDLTYSGLGFSGKICRVEALELQANGLVSVSLIEYFDVYTWEVPAQESVEILAKIPTIGAIHPPEASSIVFTDTDASAINRPTLTWTEPTDFPVRQYRVDVEDTANPPVQVFSKLVDTNSVDLSFLPVGNYNANITSFNGVGIESNAVVKSFTIGNPPTATADIQDDAVVTDKITDNAITTPKILDDAVTDAKINSLTANKITAGTIDASVITVTNLDADNITSGSIGADKITVDDLSAINSDLGDIDAGSLNIGSGAFVVTTAGAMTATSADVVGNLKTGNLVVTGDAGIHGEVRATSITAETVTVESIKQEVWNEIDRRTAPAQNGFYDDFSSTGTDGYYVGVAKNFDLLGTNDNGYQINSNDIDLRAGMVTGFATSTNYTGTALEATFQYFYKLASDSTWTALTPSYVGTTDKYTTPDGYFYELDADPSHRINSGTLTAESYYHFRLTVTPTVTNNVWTDSDAGSGYKVEYGVQQSSTGTGTGTGTVTSVSGGDGITASPSSITTTGSLAVDSTVVRTTGTQTLGGNKTFSDNVVIQGNLDVQGTTTTIDTANLDVKDKNITLNYSTGDSSASANGAGITIQDAVSATEDATLTWNTANDSFNFSHPLNVTGNISSSANISAPSFTASSSGYGTLELGGVSGAYIDLKRPNTDDFDLRLITTGTGGQINAPTGATIDLQINTSDILSVSSTGIDVTGDATFGDNDKAQFGAGNDLQIFHNGTKSVIQNAVGHLEINNNADDSDILFKSDNGSGGLTTYFMLDGGLGYSRAIKNIRFDDNVKATFGSSNDLQIYHNGSSSIIEDQGTGDLVIKGTDLYLRNSSNSNRLYAGTDVRLYYNGSEKIRTTSTGIDVTGTISSGAITSTGASSFGTTTITGNLTVDDKLTIGDATANSNSFIEFGERIAATETNKPFIGQTNSGNGVSQDLGLGANSSSGTVKIYAGNVSKFNESAVRLKVANTYINFTEPLQMGGTEFLSDARNLSNIGTISSGAITTTAPIKVLQPSSSAINELLVLEADDPNADIIMTDNTGSVRLRTSGSGDFKIFTGGAATSQNASGATTALTIDQSQNSTFAGTISSDFITADHGIKATDIWTSNEQPSSNNAIFSGYGAIGNRGTFYITNGGGGVQIGNGSTHNQSPTAIFDTAGLNMASGKAIRINGTTVITSSRSIENVTSISSTGNIQSGEITTGAIEASYDKTNTSTPVITVDSLGSDLGQFIALQLDGTTKGNIGISGSLGNDIYIAGGTTSTTGLGLRFIDYASAKYAAPCRGNGSTVDNVMDLGSAGARFDDIYATNGTIQTSDRNEKQDIQALTDAEQRVATACKGLIRRFRWQDAVEEKGDDARYHFGVIAQDLQDAFTAEGLDAGDYGMFISNTWTDDEGNEQTRLGVRYNELLAFIISTL